MQVSLKREAEYSCPDFVEIRDVLSEFGAGYVSVKEQTDHVFCIYDARTQDHSKRIKVRVENSDTYLIYIYSRQQAEVDVAFDYYEAYDPQILDILTSAFGNPKIIRKKREVWRKGSIVFHLDEVAGVGKLFEMEWVGEDESEDYEMAMAACMQRFAGCSLKRMQGSNEDLVPDEAKDGVE